MTSSARANSLKLTFLADDFTGATDALERLELAGVRTAVYMAPPSPEVIQARPELRAVGLAGATRSLPTNAIAASVRPALKALRELGAPHVHYKVCSTFDSSSTVGSIGPVIDVANELFDAPFVPVVVGSPALGRWCVFGNLFAGMGIGADSPAYRLDRHPSMSRHPVTPMDEADLTVHLGKQTDQRIGLIDVRTLDKPVETARSDLRSLLERDEPGVVLFDSLSYDHLRTIAELMQDYASPEAPLFWIGSSAVESALTSHWLESRTLEPIDAPEYGATEGPTLILVGSCSPITSTQVSRALRSGASEVLLLAETLVKGNQSSSAIQSAADAATASLREKRSTVVRVVSGPTPVDLPPDRLGQAFGQLIQTCLGHVRPGLIVVAGGDTASYTARGMGIESLEFDSALTPGAPICRAGSSQSSVEGLRVVFKGGQVGRPDLFEKLCHLT